MEVNARTKGFRISLNTDTQALEAQTRSGHMDRGIGHETTESQMMLGRGREGQPEMTLAQLLLH